MLNYIQQLVLNYVKTKYIYKYETKNASLEI
jgi:hypothetical protein